LAVGRSVRTVCPTSGALVCLLLCAASLAADESGIGPVTLGVVVNSADPQSVAAAHYYVERRGIPLQNVIDVRIEPIKSVLGPDQVKELKRSVTEQTPPHVQAYLLTWTQPFKTACMSITTAFASGFDESYCADRCALTRRSPYFDSDSVRPYDDLEWRPTMSLAAADLAQAKALVDRGIEADGTRPAGTGYLLRTSDKRRNVRAAGFRDAVAELGDAVSLRYVEADFIEGRDDVLFYFTGTKEVERLTSNRFLPGAIADHLTSGGGRLVGGKQMSVLQWLAAGATASYGTVEEPCAIGDKFPVPEIVIRRYLAGETLIEAYTKSVAMPSQGIFVGEPLARPYAREEQATRPKDARTK
jgi:uncharacterized protein (TIGR03790 family)